MMKRAKHRFSAIVFRGVRARGIQESRAGHLEFRLKKSSGKGTNFADLIWKPRLLIEMKKGNEKLPLHIKTFDYWLNAVPNRRAMSSCITQIVLNL